MLIFCQEKPQKNPALDSKIYLVLALSGIFYETTYFSFYIYNILSF